MIRFLDIERQTTWQKKIQILVLDVGRVRPIENSEDGWCQCIQARDGVGREEPLNYFWNEPVDEKDLMGKIPGTMIGNHWYDIIWRKDKEYFQCKLAEAPVEDKFEKNVWEEKDLRIAKESLLKSAATIVITPGYNNLTLRQRGEVAEEIAKDWYKWITNEE